MSQSHLYNNTLDMLEPDKARRQKNLYGSFGMSQSGDNEIGAWLRRLVQGYGPRAASMIGFGNEVEPLRQQNLRGLFQNYSPAGVQSQVDFARNQMQQQALSQAFSLANLLRSQGAGIGAQQGAQVAALNQANRQANELQTYMASPQGQQAIQQLLSQAFAQAQDTGLGPLLSMFQPIETRNQVNQASKSGGFLSGIMPIVGQLAGAGAFNGLFNRPHASGGK